ncbi:MAG: hypothetical protein EPN43_05925 [Jatrophihabitans sp.]|nr:MAG: hypothetical protein EPN43_05925 [Jatrophihabitans sp.]
MTTLRSGALAVWTSAWLAGNCAPDDVLTAATGSDAPHAVAGADSLLDVLAGWRRAGEPVRLVLPVPGDVRGVPNEASFRAAALDAAEAVVGAGLALVPEVVDRHPSSAPTSVTWRAFAVPPTPVDHLDPAEAQSELAAAIRDAASALTAAAVGGAEAGIAEALHDARHAGERLHLPPGHPPRAVALLAQAHRMRAVLDLTARDPVGGAVDRFGMSARDAALRPLATATRRALLAGYNAQSRP